MSVFSGVAALAGPALPTAKCESRPSHSDNTRQQRLAVAAADCGLDTRRQVVGGSGGECAAAGSGSLGALVTQQESAWRWTLGSWAMQVSNRGPRAKHSLAYTQRRNLDEKPCKSSESEAVEIPAGQSQVGVGRGRTPETKASTEQGAQATGAPGRQNRGEATAGLASQRMCQAGRVGGICGR